MYERRREGAWAKHEISRETIRQDKYKLQLRGAPVHKDVAKRSHQALVSLCSGGGSWRDG
eukprot:765116-Hanusia_phi.AAC.12